MSPRITLAFLILSANLYAVPAITITSPADGTVFGPTDISAPITVSITGATATESVTAFVDDYILEPNGSVHATNGQGPFTIPFFPGFYGDSYDHTLYVVSKDIFGNVLATSATIHFSIRMSGDDAFYVISPPLIGVKSLNIAVTHPRGPNTVGFFNVAIDGRAGATQPWFDGFGGYAGTGVNGIKAALDTTQFRNGTHLIDFIQWSQVTNAGSSQDFTAASNSVNTTTGAITLPYHALINARSTGLYQNMGEVTLTTTGTCPAGLTCDGVQKYYVVQASYAQSDSDSVKLSLTIGGSPIVPSTQGTGTHTIRYSLWSPWWCSDSAACGASIFPFSHRRQSVTFSNGSVPMELRPPYTDVFLTPGQSVAVGPTAVYTDGSTHTPDGDIAYSITTEGGVSGCVTVTGVGASVTITAVNPLPQSPCYATVVLSKGACTICTDISTSVRVMAQTTNIFPTFGKNGIVETAYNASNSLLLSSMWSLNQSDVASRPAISGKANKDAGVNTILSGILADFTDLAVMNCTNPTNSQATVFSDMAFGNSNYGFVYSFLNSAAEWQPWALSGINNNTGYDRQTCFITAMQTAANTGYVSNVQTVDEVSSKYGNYPTRNGIVGQGYLQSLSVSSNVGTLTTVMDTLTNYNQTTGLGDRITLQGSSTSALNGIYKITGHTEVSGVTTQITIATSGVSNGTHNAGNDAALEMVVNPVNSLEGFNSYDHDVFPGMESLSQTAYLPNVLPFGWPWDINFTGITCNGTTCTFNVTGCCGTGGLSTGRVIRVWNDATTTGTAALNTIAVMTKVNANSFTIPSTAPATTYNAASDPNLYFSTATRLGNDFITSFRTNIYGAVTGMPVQINALTGNIYNTAGTNGVKNWSTISGASNLYTISSGQFSLFGPYQSYYQGLLDDSPGIITFRAYEKEPRMALVGWPQDFMRVCKGWTFNPACDKPGSTLGGLIQRGPGNKMMWQMTQGITGWQIYGYQNRPAEDYNVNVPSGVQQFISNYSAPPIWNSGAEAMIKANRIAPYWLQPRLNSPNYGPDFSTAAHEAPANGGRALMIVSVVEIPRTETFDLSPYRYSSGSAYRWNKKENPASLTLTVLGSNPSSETQTLAPGETATYIFQASGATSDITNLVFSAPSSLPSGANKFAVQVGYYNQTLENGTVTDCTSNCTIPMNLKADSWYRILYLKTDNTIVSAGEPQRLLAR